MNLEIKYINESHIKGFHQALDLVSKEKKYLAFTAAPSLEETAKFIKNNIKNHYPQFVALVENQVIGWCDVIPYSRPSKSHAGILGIGIVSKCRGLGIGKKLLVRALTQAKNIGLEKVDLTVFVENERAFKIYQKLGFKVEGKKVKAIKIDSKYHDEILMTLFLDDFDHTS